MSDKKVFPPQFTDIQNNLMELHDKLFPELKHLSLEDVELMASLNKQVKKLEDKLERTKDNYRKQIQENDEIEQKVYDEQYDTIESLKSQLQWSIKNEEQYKMALAEAKENFMQFQSEAQRMFDVENSKLKKALEAAKQTLALIAEGEGSDESVYMAMGKAALAKIEELEKK